jgi:hypothetical protein
MSAKTELRIDFRGVDKTAGVLRGIKSSIGSFAMSAGAALAGAFAVSKIIGGARELISSLDDVGDKAQQIGMSAENFQRLGFAFEQAGLSAEAAGNSMSFMKKNIAMKGDDKQSIFKRMSMDAKALAAMAPEQQFVTIGKQIASMGSETDRTTALLEVFGKSGGDLAPMFRQGPKAFEEGLAGVMGMVDVASNKNVEMAGRMNDAFAAVSMQMKADFASAFFGIATDGEGAFGRIDVAIFSAYSKTKLFVKNTMSLFGFLKDGIEAIFTDKTFADMESLSDRFLKNIEASNKEIEKYKEGVTAKDRLAANFGAATDGANKLKQKIVEVKDSIMNFGKFDLTNSYAAIQARYGTLMPEVAGSRLRNNMADMGMVKGGGGFDKMAMYGKETAANTEKMVNILEDLEEF